MRQGERAMSLPFKRYYYLIVLLVLVAVLLIVGLGEQRIVAYTTQTNESAMVNIRLAQARFTDLLYALGIH